MTTQTRETKISLEHSSWATSTTWPRIEESPIFQMFRSLVTPFAIALPTVSLLSSKALSTNAQLQCTPTFNGVPVAAPFLMSRANPIFDKAFPGLELSGVFVIDHPEFMFEETGRLLAPFLIRHRHIEGYPLPLGLSGLLSRIRKAGQCRGRAARECGN